jgi:hypothetical protein
MTITGPKVRGIIYAIASLRAPTYDIPVAGGLEIYEWRLQFYRSAALLGTADLSDAGLVRCDGGVYDAPWTLKRLYHHIAKKSGEED